jgi:hypothetical protein
VPESSRWEKPKLFRGPISKAKGRWPVRCIAEYCAFLRQQRGRGSAGSTMSKATEEGVQIRNALARAKLAVLQFEQKIRAGELVSKGAKDVELFVIREHLLSWAGALPQKLEGLALHQMGEVIKVETHRVLTEISVGADENFVETFKRMFTAADLEWPDDEPAPEGKEHADA